MFTALMPPHHAPLPLVVSLPQRFLRLLFLLLVIWGGVCTSLHNKRTNHDSQLGEKAAKPRRYFSPVEQVQSLLQVGGQAHPFDHSTVVNRKLFHYMSNMGLRGNELKELAQKIGNVDAMSRHNVNNVLSAIYGRPLEGLASLFSKLSDDQIKAVLKSEISARLVGDESTIALPCEESDCLARKRMEIAAGHYQPGRTGAFVRLFDYILKKVFGVDINVRAREAAEAQRIKNSELIKQGLPPESLNAFQRQQLAQELEHTAEDFGGKSYQIPETVASSEPLPVYKAEKEA